jgi:hypothetical protein
MKKNITLLRILTCALLTLATTSISFAQTSSSERSAPNHQGWYQVEMIVFSRTNPAIQEHFPSNIQLHYPALWRSLKNPDNLQIHATAPADPTDSTSLPTPVVDFNSQPFYQLPKELRQLNSQADKFARSSEYQLIFHQAWRQPITHKSQAEWILINNPKNPLNELGGAIRLSVATYLVLETNLWFAELEPKVDESENIWPELPERPDLVEENFTYRLEDAERELTEENIETSSLQPKRIVLLKGKRDLRSNVTAYIDHPLVGILVKIVPFRPAAETPLTP